MKSGIKHQIPTILSFVAATGVISTTVLAVNATPKAVRLKAIAEDAKGEELTLFEKARLVGPLYIPSIMSGLLTIACIFGADALNRKQKSALIAACALASSAYREYKDKTVELLGPEMDARIRESIIRDHKKKHSDSDEEKHLFFDMNSGQYFESTLEFFEMDDGLECHIVDISPLS